MHSGRIEPKSVKNADTKNTVHMKMGGVFANIDAWRTAATLGLAMFAAWQLGRWRGRRLRAKSGKVPVSKFEDASLALLGLLLAFSFSLAIVKHDQRRTTLLADTNAIGDFYTCASLLKEPVRTKLQSVIRDYTELRVELSGRRIDEADAGKCAWADATDAVPDDRPRRSGSGGRYADRSASDQHAKWLNQ